MPLINKTLANLIGGISQQSPSLRLFNQCENQENMRSSIVNGLQSRPPLKYICAGGNSNSAFYPIDRDEDLKYNLFLSPDAIKVISSTGVEQIVTCADGWQTYLADSDYTDPYKTYKVLTLADHTFILNTKKTVKMTNDIYENWKNQALVFVKQVNYATTWTLILDGVTRTFGYGGANTEDGTSAKRYIDGVESGSSSGLSTAEVAAELVGTDTTTSYSYTTTTDTSYNSSKTYYAWSSVAAAYVKYTGGANNFSEQTLYERTATSTTTQLFPAFTITQSESTLLIRRTDGSAFSIGASDTRGNTCITVVTSKVQEFDALPTVAPDGYICRVAGAVSSNADDYYVMFNANTAGAFGKGTWEECAEPGSYYALDAATMPWKLVHVSGTSWTFGPAAWAEKETGDLDSSPLPQFVGNTLRNIFLFMNRLCFLSKDLLCMSRAAKYTNFWNETAITLTDSDPIFLSASTENLAELYDFGVLDDDLILFGQHDQFKLNTGDVLSPKTAALTSVGNNSYTQSTGIVAAGSRLFFGHKTGNYYSVSEFGTSAVTGQKEASSVTSHVPNLIVFGTMLRLCGSDNVDTLCVYSDSNSTVLSIYQYYLSGANKLQSAWHKYILHGCQIKGAFFRENILWLHLLKANQTLVVTIDMSERADNEQKEPALDYLYTVTTETAGNTVTLPEYMDINRVVVLMPLTNGVLTQVNIKNTSGQTLTLDKSSTVFYVGETYHRTFEFSTQYPSSKKADGSETAVTTGRWQLQQLSLNYGLSGPYCVNVKPLYDDAATGFSYTFAGIKVGMQSAILGTLPLSDGELSIPLRGRNTDLRVYIESDSWLPESFISAEWQGLYTTKVKQI